MDKPRVIFPYIEAGFGHIMPMDSIADEFERLYGDKVECVRSHFFTESGNRKLKKFENRLRSETLKYTKHSAYGFFATFSMDFWRVKISTWATMRFLAFGSLKHGIAHMDELNPDMVVSTHWATNYYAKKCKKKPLTAMYCPDAKVNPLFRYPCDLVMISNPSGYDDAIKCHPVRLNGENFKLVPFLIREEAFTVYESNCEVADSKSETRESLGFNKNKFTVVLAEGGYGIGKMEDICKIVLERDLPVTLVPVCGANEELYKRFLAMKSKGKTDWRPMGMVNNMFELLTAADLFCGKSGASMTAEPCFFGVPQIITKYATNIEMYIGRYYVEVVGSAMKIFKPKKVVDKIEELLQYPERLEPYKIAAQAQHGNYGATKAAEEVFNTLCKRFPELKED